MPERLPDAARLYALIGDGMHDLPVEVVKQLEGMLRRYGMPHPADAPASRACGAIPYSAQALADHLDACLVESGGDARIVAEALLDIVDFNGVRRIARVCGLPSEVLRRQLSGRRTLSFATVLGTMRALDVELRVRALAG